MNPCTKLYPVILFVDWFSVHTFDVKKMIYIWLVPLCWLVPVCWLVLCILTDTLYLRVRPELLHDVWKMFYIWLNLTKVRPLFSLSDPLCDRVKRGLTLFRLIFEWYPVCWLVPCVLAGTMYLRLRLELLHDIQEVVVDLRLVPKLELDLVQIGQGVLDL